MMAYFEAATAPEGSAGTVAVLLFPGVVPLDAVGPYQMLVALRRSGYRVVTVAKEAGIVESDGPLALRADASFESVGPVDVLVVPGGAHGTMDAAPGTATTAFVRAVYDAGATVASVCTGAWLLAGAGVIGPGDTAATPWGGDVVLERYGVAASDERVHRAGRVWTAGGVSSGIDLGLALVAELGGAELAERTRLVNQYAAHPDPAAATPAGSGHPVAPGVERLVDLVYRSMASRATSAAGRDADD